MHEVDMHPILEIILGSERVCAQMQMHGELYEQIKE